MHQFIKILYVVLIIVFVISCQSTDVASTVNLSICESSDDCSEGYSCNESTGECEEDLPACETDDDCEEGECTDGECTEEVCSDCDTEYECLEDADCDDEGYECDTTLYECILIGCSDDADCDDNEECDTSTGDCIEVETPTACTDISEADVPSNLYVSQTYVSGQLHVTWDVVSGTSDSEPTYTVYVTLTDDTVVSETDVTETDVYIDGLTDGTEYIISISATYCDLTSDVLVSDTGIAPNNIDDIFQVTGIEYNADYTTKHYISFEWYLDNSTLDQSITDFISQFSELSVSINYSNGEICDNRYYDDDCGNQGDFSVSLFDDEDITDFDDTFHTTDDYPIDLECTAGTYTFKCTLEIDDPEDSFPDSTSKTYTVSASLLGKINDEEFESSTYEQSANYNWSDFSINYGQLKNFLEIDITTKFQ